MKVVKQLEEQNIIKYIAQRFAKEPINWNYTVQWSEKFPKIEITLNYLINKQNHSIALTDIEGNQNVDKEWVYQVKCLFVAQPHQAVFDNSMPAAIYPNYLLTIPLSDDGSVEKGLIDQFVKELRKALHQIEFELLEFLSDDSQTIYEPQFSMKQFNHTVQQAKDLMHYDQDLLYYPFKLDYERIDHEEYYGEGDSNVDK
ncbi:DUF3013 family protein [Atopobacter phocae]|uniref:DUF3013 family protein n=1 Tax=Atopobacter phocae TaxID=136492 RepID=UPI00146FA2C9|nr:DUF3013 family protein [Atopobacter phocae]